LKLRNTEGELQVEFGPNI